MTTISKTLPLILIPLLMISCTVKKQQQFEAELRSIELKQGDIALCGSEDGTFGTVDFSVSCSEKVKKDFNVATALLHSFEYDEAEKMFAKVINQDPECAMAYWGVAMSNFHALWAMHAQLDLEKGYKAVALARSLDNKTERESDYLEAIAAFYDDRDKLDHETRSRKYEEAMERLYEKYPAEKEAAIFYALALNATADPQDKSFRNQKKAGEILSRIYPEQPNHPGIAHYIIHNYDYPELAHRALPAARSYAAIAPASAHAQHMPSHIFTRLGLWEESIKSNLNSISAAQCYAANIGMQGRWDEELHGIDYLVYAYLQKGQDVKAKEQVDILKTYDDPAFENGKTAYVFAATPARYALERKQWEEAAALEEYPKEFPWEKFPWENAITHFAKVLGYVHTNRVSEAALELDRLKALHEKLTDAKETYKASQVEIQILAGDGWIHFAKGRKQEAVQLLTRAAELEEATAKSPVTPGEVLPAREMLADLLMKTGQTAKALQAYELNLKRLPNRFNSLYGASTAAHKLGSKKKARDYYQQLIGIAALEDSDRVEVKDAAKFVNN